MVRGRLEVAESLSEARGQVVFGPTKNYRARTIVMPGFMREMLNDRIVSFAGPDPDGLVFSVPGGAQMRNSNFSRRVWKPVIRQAGLPYGLRVHDLRHTAVALLINRGAHREAIKRYMGHSSIAVTMDVYGHLFPSAAEDLATPSTSSTANLRRTKYGQNSGLPEVTTTQQPQEIALTRHFPTWARRGSNPRPSD